MIAIVRMMKWMKVKIQHNQKNARYQKKLLSQTKKQKNANNDDGWDRTVFLQGLPWRANENEVREFLKDCGEIESIELPLDSNGRSSGTAYVTFTELDGYENGLQMNGQTFADSGRWIKIIKGEYARQQSEPKVNSSGTSSIFVGNMSWEIDEESLRAAFADCGTITSVRFATDRETGDFRGFGHVDFDSPEAAAAAVALAGTEVCGRAIRCDFAEDRRNSSGNSGQVSPRASYGKNGAKGRNDRGYGRGGGRGRGQASSTPVLKKASGSIPRGVTSNKKITF
mmetsp:Transcript_10979/g.16486  ORF Transcript_10979/g.16486 Transcript_10979/m.16486 type:complete len:283 (+) Transcript_10979:386-1234(+)